LNTFITKFSSHFKISCEEIGLLLGEYKSKYKSYQNKDNNKIELNKEIQDVKSEI